MGIVTFVVLIILFHISYSHQVNSSAYQITADIKRGDKAMESMDMVRCDAYSITLGSNFANRYSLNYCMHLIPEQLKLL